MTTDYRRHGKLTALESDRFAVVNNEGKIFKVMSTRNSPRLTQQLKTLVDKYVEHSGLTHRQLAPSSIVLSTLQEFIPVPPVIEKDYSDRDDMSDVWWSRHYEPPTAHELMYDY